MTKRVVECNVCGEPLAAANDDELVAQVLAHHEAEHGSGPELDEDAAREMVEAEAYDAADS